MCQYYYIYIYIYIKGKKIQTEDFKKRKKLLVFVGWQSGRGRLRRFVAGESGGEKKSRCRHGLEGWYLRLEKVCLWVMVREPRRWGGYPPLLHLLLFLHCGGFVCVYVLWEAIQQAFLILSFFKVWKGIWMPRYTPKVKRKTRTQ